ncbi:MAG: FecR domain-containing protein [Lachnospiraceae bacterium]|nr:FecR domain-containing protein [Lachnospiraceae bacterium]
MKSNKKTLIALAAVCVALIAVFIIVILARNNASYRDITVFNAEGSVLIERNGKYINATRNMKLRSGDAVEVGEDSFMRLCVDDDKYLYVDANSELLINATGKKDKSRTIIEIAKGQVITEVQKKIPDGSSHENVTPNTTMAIRGTIIANSVSFDQSGNVITQNIVLEGSALIGIYSETDSASGLAQAGEGLSFENRVDMKNFGKKIPAFAASNISVSQLASKAASLGGRASSEVDVTVFTGLFENIVRYVGKDALSDRLVSVLEEFGPEGLFDTVQNEDTQNSEPVQTADNDLQNDNTPVDNKEPDDTNSDVETKENSEKNENSETTGEPEVPDDHETDAGTETAGDLGLDTGSDAPGDLGLGTGSDATVDPGTGPDAAEDQDISDTPEVTDDQEMTGDPQVPEDTDVNDDIDTTGSPEDRNDQEETEKAGTDQKEDSDVKETEINEEIEEIEEAETTVENNAQENAGVSEPFEVPEVPPIHEPEEPGQLPVDPVPEEPVPEEPGHENPVPGPAEPEPPIPQDPVPGPAEPEPQIPQDPVPGPAEPEPELPEDPLPAEPVPEPPVPVDPVPEPPVPVDPLPQPPAEDPVTPDPVTPSPQTDPPTVPGEDPTPSPGEPETPAENVIRISIAAGNTAANGITLKDKGGFEPGTTDGVYTCTVTDISEQIELPVFYRYRARTGSNYNYDYRFYEADGYMIPGSQIRRNTISYAEYTEYLNRFAQNEGSSDILTLTPVFKNAEMDVIEVFININAGDTVVFESEEVMNEIYIIGADAIITKDAVFDTFRVMPDGTCEYSRKALYYDYYIEYSDGNRMYPLGWKNCAGYGYNMVPALRIGQQDYYNLYNGIRTTRIEREPHLYRLVNNNLASWALIPMVVSEPDYIGNTIAGTASGSAINVGSLSGILDNTSNESNRVSVYIRDILYTSDPQRLSAGVLNIHKYYANNRNVDFDPSSECRDILNAAIIDGNGGNEGISSRVSKKLLIEFYDTHDKERYRLIFEQ